MIQHCQYIYIYIYVCVLVLSTCRTESISEVEINMNEQVDVCVEQTKLMNNQTALAEQMKQFEAVNEQHLPSQCPFIVRIDGVAFRNYTNGFAKPFDQRMTRAFIRTSADLLERFHPSTVYYASDEISLVFPACPPIERHVHIYSGRVQKLVSVLASFTAAKFNRYINDEDWSDAKYDNVRQRLLSNSAYFDARAFSLPDELTAMSAIYWRHHHDTMRNATLTYALSFYNHKAIHGRNMHELRDLMAREHQWSLLDDAPKNIIYGTFLKKEQFEFDGIDHRTQLPTRVQRCRTRIGSFNIDHVYSNTVDKVQFLFSKYWNDIPLTLHTIDIPDWWKTYYRQSNNPVDC
jgi:tRNA(His) guanylyltransferase